VESDEACTTSGEGVSALTVEILDELRVSVLECWIVVEALDVGRSLNLDEMVTGIGGVQRAVADAFLAASLIQQGAELEASHGDDNCPTPRSVIERHQAAVDRGASAVYADESRAARFVHMLRSLSRDEVQVTGPQPQCGAAVSNTANRCVNSALYLGAGNYGKTCYIHANRKERDKYYQRCEAILRERRSRWEDLRRECVRATGVRIADLWIQRRMNHWTWLEELANT
jgi:hypothetical protein